MPSTRECNSSTRQRSAPVFNAAHHAPVTHPLIPLQVYGLGRSEELIGKFARQNPKADSIEVATKFAALPWRTKPSDVVEAAKRSTERLGRPIDLYQIHFPNAWCNAQYWDGLADCVDRGLVKKVGVSNYGVDAMRAASTRLQERGTRLASNQIQLSLLYPFALENGLVDACRELDAEVLTPTAGKY